MAIGTFSGGGLGMGVAFSLQDNFTNTADKIQKGMGELSDFTERHAADIESSMNLMASGFQTMAVGAALIAPFALAIGQSMEFEAAMSGVGAVSGATADEMKRLSKEAIRLGAEMKFTATEAAEAQTYLAMAGFNVEQVVASLPGVMNLAAASGLGLGQSADIASSILSQFGLKAAEAGHMADVLAQAANSSNTGVDNIADAMKYLGTTASSLGVPLEEAVAVIESLSNFGLQGGNATAALSTSLTNLAKPTNQMKKVMEELNLQVFDSSGNFIGLIDLVAQLEKATASYTQEQKAAAISGLFGAQSFQEITALMNGSKEVMIDGQKVLLKGAEVLQYFTKENERASEAAGGMGAAFEMAQKMVDNLKGDYDSLTSRVESFNIILGSKLTPVLRNVTQMFTRWMDKLTLFIETPVGHAIAIIVASLGALLVVAGGAAAAIGALKFAFYSLMPAIWAAIAPLLPFIAIGAALVGAFLLLKKVYNEAILAFNKPVGELGKKGGIVGFLEKLGGLISGVKEMLKFGFENDNFQISIEMEEKLDKIGLLETMRNIGTWLVRISNFWKGFKEGFKTAWEVGKQALNDFKEMFKPLMDEFEKWGILIDKNTSDIEKWKEAGKIAAYVIIGLLGAIAIAFIAAFWLPLVIILAVIAAIWLVPKALDYIRTEMPQVWEALSKGWEILKDSILSALNFIAISVGLIIESAKALKTAFSQIKEGDFEGATKTVWEMVKTNAQSMWDYITEHAKKRLELYKSIVTNIGDIIGSVWDKVTENAEVFFDKVSDWIDRIIESLKGVTDALKNVFSFGIYSDLGFVDDMTNFFNGGEDTTNTTTRPQMRSIGGDVTDRTADYATRNAQVMQPVVIDNNTTNTEVRDVNVYLDSDKIAGKVEKRMVMTNRLNSY